MKFTDQLFRSADESLKEETRLLLLWVGSLVTLYTFVCMYVCMYVCNSKSAEKGDGYINLYIADDRDMP